MVLQADLKYESKHCQRNGPLKNNCVSAFTALRMIFKRKLYRRFHQNQLLLTSANCRVVNCQYLIGQECPQTVND